MRTGSFSIAVLLALSGIAQAGIISETLHGTIISGTDTDGDFGGGSLAGDSFTLSFSYDPSVFNYQDCSTVYVSPCQGLNSEDLVQSNLQTTTSPVLDESISVNTPSTYTQTATLTCLQTSTPFIHANLVDLGGVYYTQFNINGGPEYCGDFVFGTDFVSDAPWAVGTILSQSAMDLMLSTPDPHGGTVLDVGSEDSADELTVQWSAEQSTPEPSALILLAVGLGGVALLTPLTGLRPDSRT